MNDMVLSHLARVSFHMLWAMCGQPVSYPMCEWSCPRVIHRLSTSINAKKMLLALQFCDDARDLVVGLFALAHESLGFFDCVDHCGVVTAAEQTRNCRV